MQALDPLFLSAMYTMLTDHMPVGQAVFAQLSLLIGLAFVVLEVQPDLRISANLHNDGQLQQRPPCQVSDVAWVLLVVGEYKVFLPRQKMELGQLPGQKGSQHYVLLSSVGVPPKFVSLFIHVHYVRCYCCCLCCCCLIAAVSSMWGHSMRCRKLTFWFIALEGLC